MIQTILFAADMGLHTHYLLHHVNALAAYHSARVIVVHVIEPPTGLGGAVIGSFLSPQAREELEASGIDTIISGVKGRILDLLEEEFVDGQQGLSKIRDVRVVAGRAADVILEEVASSNADMIIMGSHGHHVDKPNVLGSVTSRVLQLSRVPVYMVPLVRNLQSQAWASERRV